MMACGGGKNGSGSKASFAVAISHSVRKSPSTNSHGALRRTAEPVRPRKSALSVPRTAITATTNALIPSDWVRDQSPRSSHNRHEIPNAPHAAPAAIPGPEIRLQPMKSRPRECPCADRLASAAAPSDSEYVDIDTLRKFGGIGAGFENRDDLQIIRIGLELPLEYFAHRMVMVGVIACHRLKIGERCRLRGIRLE